MNKTAIKNFAVWARNKLIADITYKAELIAIRFMEVNDYNNSLEVLRHEIIMDIAFADDFDFEL